MEFLPIKKKPLDHFIINNVLILLATVVVVLRLVARRIRRMSLGADDYCIAASMPFVIGMFVVQGLYARLGAGYPITEVPLANLTLILQLLIASALLFSIALLLVKMSILFFYLRLFINSRMRVAVKVVMGITLAWSVGNVVQVFLICRPFRSTWDISVKGVCGDRKGSYIAIGVFNVITDWIILTLPIPTVWGLHMEVSRKIALTFVFSIGLLVSIVGILRMTYLATLDFNNLTGTMADASFYSAAEPILAVISVCLPMLRPIVTFIFPSLLKRDDATSAKHGNDRNNRMGQSMDTFAQIPEDGYSMGNMYNGRGHGKSKVSSKHHTGGLDGLNGGRAHSQDSGEPLRGNNIAVQKDWTVQTG